MTTIRLRRGTAAEWATRNPILALGEYGFETDTRKSKVGNGSTAWNSLAYVSVADAFDADDVGYDLVLIAGQSNAVGQGLGAYAIDTTRLDPIHDRIDQWPGSGELMALGRPVRAVDPLLHRTPFAGCVGPGLPFAREVIGSLKPNRKILLVPVAQGGTGFSSSSVNPPPTGYNYTPDGGWDASGGQGGINLYESAIASANAAMAYNPNNRILCLIWVQGERDGGQTQSWYADKLDALIDGFRSRITGAANMPVIIGQMLPSYIAATAGLPGINAAHIDTPRRKLLTAFNYGVTDPARNDGGAHYDNEANRVNGYRMATVALPLARANVLGTAPVAPTNVVLSQSGTSVDVSWTRTLGRFTDFNVRYRSDGGAWSTLTRAQSIDTTATITGLSLGSVVEVQVRSVNEQGNSSWSLAGSITLVRLPGQASITLGSPTFPRIAYTITAPSVVAGTTSAATDYLVEYRLSPSGAWVSAGSTSSLTGTVGGLAPLTAYDIRATAANAAGAGPASTVQTATTGPAAALLDVVDVTAYRAFGLRKLRAAYSGSAIRVRYTNGTEADIGFVSNGDLDTSTLLSGASANGGGATIKTWYDQSGGGRDSTQTTVSQQARIVNSNTLDQANSKPAAVFSSAASTLYSDTTNLGLVAAGSASALAVFSSTNRAAGNPRLFFEGGTGSLRYALINHTAADGKLFSQLSNDANVYSYQYPGQVLPDSTLSQVSAVDTGSTIRNWVNGSAGVLATYTRTGTYTPTVHQFGGQTLGQTINALVSEMVQWTTALTDAQRLSGEANQKAWYGTP